MSTDIPRPPEDSPQVAALGILADRLSRLPHQTGDAINTPRQSTGFQECRTCERLLPGREFKRRRNRPYLTLVSDCRSCKKSNKKENTPLSKNPSKSNTISPSREG